MKIHQQNRSLSGRSSTQEKINPIEGQFFSSQREMKHAYQSGPRVHGPGPSAQIQALRLGNRPTHVQQKAGPPSQENQSIQQRTYSQWGPIGTPLDIYFICFFKSPSLYKSFYSLDSSSVFHISILSLPDRLTFVNRKREFHILIRLLLIRQSFFYW